MTSSSSPSPFAIRGAFLDLIQDPFLVDETECIRYIPDGLLVLENGRIQALGAYESLCQDYRRLPVVDYGDRLIIPGLIDSHVHYSQTEIIASYGAQLLDWLNTYTFPAERKFQEAAYAEKIANFFLDELLRYGTTSALVLTTIFPKSVTAFFEAAHQRNMRMITGQVLMSRNAPQYLLNDAKVAQAQTREQIQTWHGKGRQLYAITPRFAITSTPEELELAGELKAEFSDVYVHTHLSENHAEIAFTAELFPETKDYLEVYEKFGLVSDRSIFAHCLHLSESEFERMAEAGGAIAFCPTSNLFLGSGLFKLDHARASGIRVGLATDVGGGSSFSMFATMAEAYKVMQLQGYSLSPFKSLYLATLGAAHSLSLEDKIGNFEVGKEADFVVLDRQATPLLALRNAGPLPQTVEALAKQLFALIVLGDDRLVEATYVAGEKAWARAEA
ncbi:MULTISPECIES: guanine deaminase [unclassified Leptolyngbya]|uniref:guanine deaminase n=1 Tax=unclassified Leptolyngbya TaxID=2650499 RepID=UPI0016852453|nr:MULTISPECIES: guanine deaminase [unclassified Leptolyngbya]MBD1911629.1 guanine deaminase [Leptolyngbya sp. FACHB-8]MBD2153194.1 guanine deaminase [Leptolyngbya sp. FACHB-16]